MEFDLVVFKELNKLSWIKEIFCGPPTDHYINLRKIYDMTNGANVLTE
jgi:hypothetical protein